MGFAQAQLPGAVFTTLPDGGSVDHNIYSAKPDVYLNGGPRSQNGSLLLDGIYFFQVTNPNGATLLSTTSAWDRLIRVDNGRFAGRCDANGNLLPNVVSPHPNATTVNPNGGIGVQLFPFNNTPNNGGEYKVWAMLYREETSQGVFANPIASVDANDNTIVHFSQRFAKTDNFKVIEEGGGGDELWDINISKFYDTNMNGLQEPNELPVVNFGIEVILGDDEPGFVLTQPAAITYEDVLEGTAYEICEVIPPDQRYVDEGINNAATRWLQTAPGAIGDTEPDNCFVGVLTGDLDAVFGNIALAKLKGVKFYDANYNGIYDQGEPGLAGFDVKIDTVYPDGSLDTETVTTGANGVWESKLYPEGTTYTVTETVPAGWEQTFPANLSYNGVLLGPGPTDGAYDVSYTVPDVENLDFGNIKRCPISGVKFYDDDMDGVQDAGELGVSGVTIHLELTLPDDSVEIVEVVTGADGSWTTPNTYPDGTDYVITENALGSGWLQTGPKDKVPAFTYTGTLTGSEDPTDNEFELECDGFDFGNIQTAKLKGIKFYDTDGDGAKDAGEPGLAGFTIKIHAELPDGTIVDDTVVTGVGGVWESPAYPDGTEYTVTEDLGTSTWLQTYPAGGSWQGTIDGGSGPYSASFTIENVDDLDFGNIQRCHFSGVKFYDLDMDGIRDAGEAGVGGVTIHLELTLPDGTNTTVDVVTAADGTWETPNLYPDGTDYVITENALGANWLQTGPQGKVPPFTYSGTLSGDGNPTDNTYELNCDDFDFGNIQLVKISGKKFFDTNHDGDKDTDEPPIQGFKIIVKMTYPNGTQETFTLYTDANGQYQTPYVPVGSSYEVYEIAPNGDWVQTFPVANGGKYLGTIPVPNGPYTVSSTAPNITGLNFLNYFCVEGDGRTPGFWSNKNGYKKMNDGGTIQPELDMLNALPLKKGNGSDAPTFTTHTQFASWLLNGNATNMAYMLSVHLAAMSLNIEAGFVDPNQVMYAPGTASADANGYATVGAIVAEAIAALTADGYTPSGDPNRAIQTALKNALDKGNNNLNWFCAPITVIVPSPY